MSYKIRNDGLIFALKVVSDKELLSLGISRVERFEEAISTSHQSYIKKLTNKKRATRDEPSTLADFKLSPP